MSTPAVRRALLVLLALLGLARGAPADDAAAPHVKLEYDGVDAPWAEAIAQTLSAARQIYVDDFGFDMPDTVVAHVTCGPGTKTRLWTDGKDRVFLSLASQGDLGPPAVSGVFNLYGMCHEMGHMAMYRILERREWLTEAGAEGWAHWAGSVVVDRVFEKKGEALWPTPYDYGVDGTRRLAKALQGPKASETDRAAGHWQRLDAILGHEELPQVFRRWQAAAPDPAHAREALGKALREGWPAKARELDAWWKAAAPRIARDRAASDFAPSTVDASKLAGKPIVLAGDDGTAESKRSIAGSGHARAFDAPAQGDAYLTAVHVFGARYGVPDPEATFEITLCDERLRPIASWTRPYAGFGPGGMAWARFEIPPTRVPKAFQVCVAFAPTATKGVFVGIDQGTQGHSRAALPGGTTEPMRDGDWMIRAEVRHGKSAGPSRK